MFWPTWVNGVGGDTTGLAVYPGTLFLQLLRFVPHKSYKYVWVMALWSGLRAAESVPVKSLKAKGLWYSVATPWGGGRDPGTAGASHWGPLEFPGGGLVWRAVPVGGRGLGGCFVSWTICVPLRLGAASPGLCPDAFTPHRAQEVGRPLPWGF